MLSTKIFFTVFIFMQNASLKVWIRNKSEVGKYTSLQKKKIQPGVCIDLEISGYKEQQISKECALNNFLHVAT